MEAEHARVPVVIARLQITGCRSFVRLFYKLPDQVTRPERLLRVCLDIAIAGFRIVRLDAKGCMPALPGNVCCCSYRFGKCRIILDKVVGSQNERYGVITVVLLGRERCCRPGGGGSAATWLR